MSQNYKYFIHGENGRDDDIKCTHPLVSSIRLIKNLEVSSKDDFRLPLPLYEIVVCFNKKKEIPFGGEFISSAIEFADRYLRTVFPFDTFVINQGDKRIEFSSENGNKVILTATAGSKSISHTISSDIFIKLMANTINSIPASQPFGEVKTMLEIFMEKLAEK